MKTNLLLLFFLGGLLSASANPITHFTDMGAAVKNAQASGRQILFVITKPGSEEGSKVLDMLQDNSLGLDAKEVIVVTCSSANPAHAKLFTERFGVDLAKLPAAVVSDATGKVLSSLSGQTTLKDYEGLATKAGLYADSTMGKGDDRLTRIFDILREDLITQVVITEYRDWSLEGGEVLKSSALLEAKGEFGIFRTKEEKHVKIFFEDLVSEDLEFLEEILQPEAT